MRRCVADQVLHPLNGVEDVEAPVEIEVAHENLSLCHRQYAHNDLQTVNDIDDIDPRISVQITCASRGYSDHFDTVGDDDSVDEVSRRQPCRADSLADPY